MFLTLNEYLLGARKILSIYGYNCLKNDEDAISYVAHYMMVADETWDGHSSNRDTWRFNQARYAIMKLKTKHQKRKKLVSLNKIVGINGNKKTKLSDIIEDKRQNNTIKIFIQVMDEARKLLTERQFSCIKMYYHDDMTLEQIGQSFNLTRERIRQIIKESIGIIKNGCKSKIDYSIG